MQDSSLINAYQPMSSQPLSLPADTPAYPKVETMSGYELLTQSRYDNDSLIASQTTMATGVVTPVPVVKSQATWNEEWLNSTAVLDHQGMPTTPLPSGVVNWYQSLPPHAASPMVEAQPPLDPTYATHLSSSLSSMYDQGPLWQSPPTSQPAILDTAITVPLPDQPQPPALPRRHTVSSADPPLGTIHPQQVKMRKMIKARRHRSMGRLEAMHMALPAQPVFSPMSATTSPITDDGYVHDPFFMYVDNHISPIDTMQPSPTTDGTLTPISTPSHNVMMYPYLVQPIYHPPGTAPHHHHHPSPSAPVSPVDSYYVNHLHGQPLPPPAAMGMISSAPFSLQEMPHASCRDLDDSVTPEIHTCQWLDCRMQFDQLEALIDHVKSFHIGGGHALYYCHWKNCHRNDKPFTKRHKMYNHLRTHTGERPFICTEDGCGKRFSRPDSLATHLKIHTNIRPFSCKYAKCDKAYYHLRSLRKHEKSHELPPPMPAVSSMGEHLSSLDLADS